MLAPSFCLCLAVPLYPSLGERVCPEPTAELRPQQHHCRVQSAVMGTSGKHGSWEHPMGATATLLGWGWPERLLGQLWLGAEGGWQLPGIQCSQFCPWWFVGSGLGSLAFARVP